MKTINSLRVLKYLEQGDSWFLIFFGNTQNQWFSGNSKNHRTILERTLEEVCF
jgi:hypothetical protein